jgi:hypothetical protein
MKAGEYQTDENYSIEVIFNPALVLADVIYQMRTDEYQTDKNRK